MFNFPPCNECQFQLSFQQVHPDCPSPFTTSSLPSKVCPHHLLADRNAHPFSLRRLHSVRHHSFLLNWPPMKLNKRRFPLASWHHPGNSLTTTFTGVGAGVVGGGPGLAFALHDPFGHVSLQFSALERIPKFPKMSEQIGSFTQSPSQSNSW